MLFREVQVPNDEPSNLHNHSAMWFPGMHGIVLWGGSILDREGKPARNRDCWMFHVYEERWSKLDLVDLRLATEPG